VKVLVLGGSGRVGKGTAYDLNQSDSVSKIILGDINIDEANRFVKRIGSKKIKTEYVNILNSKQLIEKMKEVDVIANAAWFESVVGVTKAAIVAKKPCCDAGGFYYDSLKQLELNEEAKKADITCVMGMGSSPGITNVCVAYAAKKLDEIVEIHLRASGSVPKPGSKVVGRTMTIRTAFEELTDNPIVYKNGKVVFVDPRSGEEKVVFPEPFGERKIYYARHSELATLPGFKGAKTVDFKIYQSPQNLEMARILEDTGITSKTPIKIGDLEIIPREVLLKCLTAQEKETNEPEGEDITGNQIVVVGKKNGETEHYTYDLVGGRNLKWGNTKVGVPLSITCQMLGNGEISEKGVIPPEGCIDPDKFFVELRKREGFDLVEEYRHVRTL
jgi:lysine 6-dehydrogenase